MSKVDRARWLIHRLSAMTPAEIAARVLVAWKEKFEGGAIAQLRVPEALTRRPVPALPLRSELPADLGRKLGEEAVALKDGRWTIFRTLAVDVGSPVCWLRDPLAHVDLRTPRRAHELDHRRLPAGADIRMLWEINRWGALVRVAQAGWLNKNPKAEWCEAELAAWSADNPLGVGWNWTSPMEAALRLIGLCWIDALGGTSEQSGATVSALAWEHAFWIQRYRSVGSSANNHLLGELAALVCAQARWPELKRVYDLETTVDHLEREILLQFAPDGGNREQALHYHLFAFEYCVQAAVFLRGLGRSFRPEVKERLKRAADFFGAVCPPTGDWDYGDCDDALVVPLTLDHSTHVAEWRAWCLGERGTVLEHWIGDRGSLLGAATQRPGGWDLRPETGMAAFASEDWFVRFDATPLGYLSTRAHGHLDALHVSAWIRGEAFLIDPGTGAYYSDGRLREKLAAAAAHNGPLLAEDDYPQRQGTFLWSGDHVSPRLEISDGAATARWQPGPKEITRRVAIEGSTLSLRDEGDSSLVRWTFAPGWAVTVGEKSTFLLEKGGTRVRLSVEGAVKAPQIEEVLCSPSFRKTEKTFSIVLPTSAPVPLESTFTILP